MLVLLIVIIMMMVVKIPLLCLFKKCFQLIIKSILLSHSLNKLCSCKLLPLSCNYRSLVIVLSEKSYTLIKLFLRKPLCMAEYKTACISDLIVKELTEVLLIHFTLLRIYNSCKSVKLNIVSINVFNCSDNIAELTYTRRLNKNSVGLILFKHLNESFSEVTYKTAADASLIHFSDLNTCVL